MSDPAGSHVRRVAIVGTGGQIGSHITACLLKTEKHIVTALTRADSSNKLPENVKSVIIDYEKEATIVDALRGQEFLIITLTNMAVHSTQPKLISAAAKAGVSYVMPNWYGPDLSNETFAADIMVAAPAQAAIKQIQDAGMVSVTLACSFWYEFSLTGYGPRGGGGTERYGFDCINREVVLIDDGKQKINTSTLEQCGRAVASLLSLPKQPQEGVNEPALSHWANKLVYCSSFTISQMDMFDSIKRVTNTTDADWTITRESSKQRYDSSLEQWKNGEVKGLIRASYTRVFFPDGVGDFGSTCGLDNEALSLPQEDLDACTGRALGESSLQPRQ